MGRPRAAARAAEPSERVKSMSPVVMPVMATAAVVSMSSGSMPLAA
jgi:hypothetical protein